MRKKLDTRFPATRIKKIMQSDEDVGKIAMAVPLLVSKALELFLQDLCDRTYDITLERGAKTLNSLHLKQCVQTFNVFDFLTEIVSRVPDLGGSDAAGDDHSVAKRRKVGDDEENENYDESRRSRMHELGQTPNSGRGRGRGRGRSRGRGSRAHEQEVPTHLEKTEEDESDACHSKVEHNECLESVTHGEEGESESELTKENNPSRMTATPVHNFDLNVDLNVDGDKPSSEMRREEYPGWSPRDLEKMALDPVQLTTLSRRIDEEEEEEDYDEES